MSFRKADSIFESLPWLVFLIDNCPYGSKSALFLDSVFEFHLLFPEPAYAFTFPVKPCCQIFSPCFSIYVHCDQVVSLISFNKLNRLRLVSMSFQFLPQLEEGR